MRSPRGVLTDSQGGLVPIDAKLRILIPKLCLGIRGGDARTSLDKAYISLKRDAERLGHAFPRRAWEREREELSRQHLKTIGVWGPVPNSV